MRSRVLLRVVVVALGMAAGGCAPYPRVKGERLDARPKLAIVSFQSEPLMDGVIPVPVQLERLDAAHTLFAEGLRDLGFEVVPTDDVRACTWYHRLPQPKVDRGTTARGLSRVQLTHKNVHGLASCSGAQVSVAVYVWPKGDSGMHVGLGRARVEVLLHVLAWDDSAEEVWRERLTVYSDPVPLSSSVTKRDLLKAQASQALVDATVQSLERLRARLAPSSPAPLSGQ